MDWRKERMTVFSLSLTMAVAIIAVDGSCLKFTEFIKESPSETTFTCSPECMQLRRLEYKQVNVFGTFFYQKNSDLCLSALHARTLNISGGRLTVQKHAFHQEEFVGSCRNRICSKSTKKEKSIVAFSTAGAKQITNPSVKGDVILIHGSYHAQRLQVLCLKEDAEAKYGRKNLRSWDYGELRNNKRDYKTPMNKEDQSKLLFSLEQSQARDENKHALMCLGRTELSDVLAPINYQDAFYKVSQYTWRGSKDDDVIIMLDKTTTVNARTPMTKIPTRYTPRLRINDQLNPSRIELIEAKAEDTGLYLLSNDKRKGAYFNILIRDCKDGKYGTNCQQDCPDCQNGGQCHSDTGECICPPGFIGDRCQHACLKGLFGTQCQFQCDKKTLLLDPPEADSCKGLTFCFPSPLGCSCSPGFKGSLCKNECGTGEFGAGCSESCNKKCASENCDQTTGSCLSYRANPGVTDLSISASVPERLSVTWEDINHPDSPHLYIITYQMMKVEACRDNSPKEEPKQILIWNNKQVTLENLEAGADYNVCVVSSDAKKGHSEFRCKTSKTQMQEPLPNISASCWIPSRLDLIRCQVVVLGDCLSWRGTNTRLNFQLTSYLECNKTHITGNYTEKLDNAASTTITKDFQDLPRGLDYGVTIKLLNDAGEGQNWTRSLPLGNPFPQYTIDVEVRDMVVTPVSNSIARIQWKNPCPSPTISYYRIYITGDRYPIEFPASSARCPKYVDYDGCYKVTKLVENYFYESCNIAVGNEYYHFGWNYFWGPEYKFNFTMEETPPTEPGLDVMTVDDRGGIEENILHLAMKPPRSPGGRILNCTLMLDSKQQCSVPYSEEELMNCTIQNLLPGKLYEVEAYCCHEKLCGDHARMSVAMKPDPELVGQVKVGEITSSTIAILLPKVLNGRDGSSTTFVAVEHLDAEHPAESRDKTTNFEMEAKRILEATSDFNQRNKRHLAGLNTGMHGRVWIAGDVTSDSREFIVGSGERSERFINWELTEGDSYNLGVLVVTKVLDKWTEMWQQLDTRVVVRPSPKSPFPIILTVLLLLLLVTALISAIVYGWKNPEKLKEIRALITPSGGLSFPTLRHPPSNNPPASRQRDLPFSPSVQYSNPVQSRALSLLSLPCEKDTVIADTEPIYENLGEGNFYDNSNRRIPASNAENYLNNIIGSLEASQEFSSVPTFMKEITVGSLPIHKKKNRYRNNLPYDETRVKLAVINNDSTTDYINANHIQGYSQETRYIATQGPKESNQSTIIDFWRMVVEQQVAEIIMVANFYEGGKCKVGQYLKFGEDKRFDNYLITVKSSKQLPYFTISNVEVVVDGEFKRNVIHYHFTSWPDHGILEEPYSVASLIATFLDHHQGGTVVVHCSAGIGRTGTILMVLLLHEMLSREGTFDPLEVLYRLREGRARLIENKDQYDFALQVFDEILYGNSTTTFSEDLQNNFDTLLDRCQTQYARANGLVSSFSYKWASEFSHLQLNRNPNILPSSKRQIFLNMENGRPESQYVNAVKVDGFAENEAMIVMEYPVRAAVRAFWRLVIEKNCSVVLMLNSYKNDNKDNFERLFPDINEEMSVGGYLMRSSSGDFAGNNIYQFSLTIGDKNGTITTVQVYQVLDWEYGCPVPEDGNVLLSVADILMQIKTPTNRELPLLCCGDGVTSCGLIATLTFLLKRAQADEVFDVYRAVVKMRRCREQFITCPEQFTALYIAASQYVSKFSIYANIN